MEDQEDCTRLLEDPLLKDRPDYVYLAQPDEDSRDLSPVCSSQDYLLASPQYSPPAYSHDIEHDVDMRSLKDHRVQPLSSTWFAKLWTWIVTLSSVYSTALSALWLVLATRGYRFQGVNQPGQWTLEDLSTGIAAQAKTIELTFVLACVACVGQELTKRLVQSDSRGITMSEMQLKFFLTQPGSIITNFHAFISIMRSFLGILVVFSSIIAMLYTTASDALVSPKTSMRNPITASIAAQVEAPFLNQPYIQGSCPVQVNSSTDPDAFSACGNIQQTGLAFRNLIQYLGEFTPPSSSDPLNPGNRPPPLAFSETLSNVQGAWVSGVEVPSVFQNISGTIVNNVTLQLPHVGVVPAAQSFASSVVPQDQNGAGELELSASVLTPTLEVFCADMESNHETIQRIVISEWPADYNRSLGNVSRVVDSSAEYVNSTWYDNVQFDPLWKFSYSNRPPVFPALPGPNNTRISWSQQTNGSVYILARDPASHLFMCRMRARLAGGCSTNYHWTIAGGNLTIDCGANNPQSYQSPNPPVQLQTGLVAAANEWSFALGIGEATDQNGSLARLLTQLWPMSGQWTPSKPTFAESLAVLAASILLSGSTKASLSGDVDENGYPAGSPGPFPISTAFNASVSISDYAAGGTSNSQRAFYPILVGAFLINCACLVYLLWRLARHGDLLQDYLDPQNLFSLALNSRPSDQLASASIEPLSPRQLQCSWKVQRNTGNGEGRAIRQLHWKDLQKRWVVMGGHIAKYIHPLESRERRRRWWMQKRSKKTETGQETA